VNHIVLSGTLACGSHRAFRNARLRAFRNAIHLQSLRA